MEATLPQYYNIYRNKFWISNLPFNLLNTKKINKQFCIHYLFFRYDYVYGNNKTFLKNINFVEAATSVYFFNSKIKIKKYWDKSFDQKKYYNISYNHAKKKTLSILKKCFKEFKLKKNLKNSILALSGGLDSATVAAIFKINKHKLKSFTAFYNSNDVVNETQPAKKIAQENCKSWKKIEINSKQFFNEWKSCYDIFSFPVCTSSFLGYLILYKKVKKLGYKNIINAGVGDHFFLGNFTVLKYFLADLFFNKDKSFILELNCWIKNFSTLEFPKTQELFFKFLKKHNFKKYGKLYSYKLLPELTGSNYLNKRLYNKDLNIFKGSSFIDAYQKQAIWFSERQPGLLPFLEIENFTQLKSIDPFDQIKLKNFFYNLNPKFKIKNGIGKTIIRDVLKKNLPECVLENKSKIGFNVPFSSWMLEDNEMHSFILKKIKLFKKLPFKDIVKIEKLILDFSNKKAYLQNTENSMFIWQITNLVMWYCKKNFI